IAKPTHGVLTGINEQHMATFGSQENIINTKYELVESLPAEGMAFFNSKNKYCRELYEKTKGKKVLYGESAAFPGGENILGAVAVAKELGMTEEEIAKAVREIGNTFPGVEVTKGKDGITILNAMYSANPDGVIANLEYLRTFPGKKVLVMPCLIELGPFAGEVHKRIAKKVIQVCDLAIITTGEYFETLSQGSDKVVFSEDPQDIVEKIKNTTQGSGAVLLEGRVPLSILTLL
ncbi:MAG: Mur ligase family protein, partial [bacterium]|nr:Mur ligase family protein [bacterium]